MTNCEYYKESPRCTRSAQSIESSFFVRVLWVWEDEQRKVEENLLAFQAADMVFTPTLPPAEACFSSAMIFTLVSFRRLLIPLSSTGKRPVRRATWKCYLLSSFEKLLDCQTRFGYWTAEGSPCNFWMVWDGECCDVALLSHDNVTPLLACNRPTEMFEYLDNLGWPQQRNWRHLEHDLHLFGCDGQGHAFLRPNF